MGVEVAGRFAKGLAGGGLGAEFAARPPFGDVEIDLHHAPLAQHKVDPERERELEDLAHNGAPRPKEQVLGGLLCDGRAAAHLGEIVGVLDRGAQLAEVDPVVGAKTRVLGQDDRERQRRRNRPERCPGAHDRRAFRPAP